MRKIPVTQVVGIVALVVILGFVLGQVGLKTYQKYQVQLEINKLKQQAAALEEKNKSLSKLADSFESEHFLEKEARKRLNVQAPDEKVVVIIPEQEATSSTPSQTQDLLLSPTDSNSNIPPWQLWLDYFFD
ncbi:MAG: hypothetical protein A2666_01185 [Parcubacteria group bacterium RIFCSPHIGHO2_01_FULL_47_10b]|nr:MAG: hypothetical protein A2666_01185 [Parcubacteria group bacterium RIFCSPHIGHO2_01_FULL_47_10b]